MSKLICESCKDLAIYETVIALIDENPLRDDESLIFKYLMLHKDTYIDTRELAMLLHAVREREITEDLVVILVEDLRKKLVCTIGLELIERNEEYGYKLSEYCMLLHMLS